MISIALAFTLMLAPDTVGRPGTFPLQQRPPTDAWFAEDKLKHAFMSLATVSFAYAGVRTVGVQDGTAVVIAAGVSALAGVGKELHDRRRGASFSLRDLAWDALGTALGALLVANVRQ